MKETTPAIEPARANVSVAEHGGPHGEADARIPVRIDCSTSVNAYGPARSVVEAVRMCCEPSLLERYPDPQSWESRSAIAAASGTTPRQVLVGAGAAELIHFICAAYVRPGDVVLVPDLAFGEYARSALAFGARVISPGALRHSSTYTGESALAALPETSAAAFCSAVERERPRLAFLCSPENPTGRAWTPSQLRSVADTCRATGSLLVLDQAYDAFTPQPIGTPAFPLADQVIHLRSLTKDHALAGLRVAYALAAASVVQAVDEVRVPWAVSTAAQAALIATLAESARAHVVTTTAALRESAQLLAVACTSAGFQVTPTDTHYFVAAVPACCSSASELRQLLLEADGIKVRDCASFGLPRHIRMAARTPRETASIIDAIESATRSAPTPRQDHDDNQ